MKAYWAKHDLDLMRIMPELTLRSRIYFNDNLSPLLSRTLQHAKQLKQTGVISGFRQGNGFITVTDASGKASRVSTPTELSKRFPKSNSLLPDSIPSNAEK